ncbi:uncharacterized protein LMH87_008494 [Akanthomyces muscarius]|uniref:Uncharacterized protein n=1 Tax=Akanthomyces muscarius TaxID=2231603 RepID=A0A9W8UPT9_AKAMU|nr:uncharacterized protein LMH87_008494 [Akanthomyces muscarius]KAJ4157942.1 hypothetical protein LMH87_008494 [Akanthomyces muscarius]
MGTRHAVDDAITAKSGSLILDGRGVGGDPHDSFLVATLLLHQHQIFEVWWRLGHTHRKEFGEFAFLRIPPCDTTISTALSSIGGLGADLLVSR